MFKRFLEAPLMLILVGAVISCATPGSSFSKPDLSKIDIGMSEQEVESLIGKPDEVAYQGRVKYAQYNFDHPFDGRIGIVDSYYVRFVSGKVESFGRKGDFGSTKDLSIKDRSSTPAIDININERSFGKQGCDLYVELKKLDALQKEGLLTNEEIAVQKTRLLAICE